MEHIHLSELVNPEFDLFASIDILYSSDESTYFIVEQEYNNVDYHQIYTHIKKHPFSYNFIKDLLSPISKRLSWGEIMGEYDHVNHKWILDLFKKTDL